MMIPDTFASFSRAPGLREASQRHESAPALTVQGSTPRQGDPKHHPQPEASDDSFI
jgi:hypothetical protein